jgi:hypothetical protein
MSEPKKKAVKAKPVTADDGMVTLATLAAELKIEPKDARRKLREADVKRGEGRWSWKEGSAELTKIKKLLLSE